MLPPPLARTDAPAPGARAAARWRRRLVVAPIVALCALAGSALAAHAGHHPARPPASSEYQARGGRLILDVSHDRRHGNLQIECGARRPYPVAVAVSIAANGTFSYRGPGFAPTAAGAAGAHKPPVRLIGRFRTQRSLVTRVDAPSTCRGSIVAARHGSASIDF